MSFNGSGVYVLPAADTPAVPNTLIESTKYNNVNTDLATALSTCITKDGQQTVTANIPFNGNKLTGIGAATARTDAASIATIQDGTGIYIATVGGTADVITLTPSPAITAYAAGQAFYWTASGANTTNVTIAISGLAAKAVTKNGSTALVAGDIPSGALVGARYDGTRFQLETMGAATFIPPFVDSTALVKGSGDATKLLAFEADTNIPTATTVTVTPQSVSGTMALVQNQIQPITASVAASALTITLNPTSLAFRSATIGSGTINVRNVNSAITTVISSGSTAGTVNAVLNRLMILAIDNAGTVELAWCNAGGSSVLDESILISTTAEGGAGAADSADVIYSTTARTNVPFRIMGYIESTQATAGTWATAPSTIQGWGGQQSIMKSLQMVLMTSIAATSGTSINFTGIPAWAKRITVYVYGLSTNGTSNILLQIGNGSIISTGYLGSTSTVAGASTNGSLYTTGFGFTHSGGVTAANITHGTLILNLIDYSTNKWVCTGSLARTDSTANYIIGGSLALSSQIDRIRITMANGTDTFDAGTVNVLYE